MIRKEPYGAIYRQQAWYDDDEKTMRSACWTVFINRHPSRSWRGDFEGELAPDQDPQGGPFFVGGAINGDQVWVYRSAVYTTKQHLDPEAVEALILEGENKVKVRVARAKALMVQAQALDHAAENKRPPIPDDVKMYVWQRDGGKCIKCGSTRNLEYDHDIPFSLGGSTTARNLRLLCETCNRSKGGSLL